MNLPDVGANTARKAPGARFLSLQIRIFLAFGISIALLLAAGGWAAMRAFNATERRQVEAQQQHLVSLLAQTVDATFSTCLEALASAAQSCPDRLPAQGRTARQWLEHRDVLRALFPSGSYLARPDGRIVASQSEDLPAPATGRLEAFFRQVAVARHPGISRTFQLGPGGTAAVVMAAPCLGPDGQTRLILAGRLDLAHDAFLGALVQERLMGGGYVTLEDGTGHTLLGASPPRSTGAPPLTTHRRLATVPWVVVASIPEAATHAPILRLRRILQASSALAMLVALALTWLLSHGLTRNLEAFTRQLEDAADRPPGQRTILTRAHDETRILVDAFNGLMTRLDQKAATIQEARARNDQELALAKHVLQRLVEPGLAALPSHFHMETLRTERINGDACTYRQGPGGLHFGLLCDATGHGLTAGISTLPAIQAFLTMARRDVPLETIYREINQRIHQLMPVDRFLCLFLIRLDLRNGVLSLLNAGLPDAILSLPGAGRRRFPSRNLPAGIRVGGQAPEVETVAVPPGSRLLAFTDGVLDLFPGTEAETRLFQGLDGAPLEVHRDAIRETLALAIENREQHDDVSWALWEVPEPVGLTVPAAPEASGLASIERDESLALALDFQPGRIAVRDLVPEVVRLLAARGVSGSLEQVLALTLSEALHNAVDHGVLHLDPALKPLGFEAYEAIRKLHLAALPGGSVHLEIQLWTLPSGPVQDVVVTVEDPGPGFDWQSWEQSQPGGAGAPPGRGLALLKALSRELTFNAAGNRIRFTLARRTDTAG